MEISVENTALKDRIQFGRNFCNALGQHVVDAIARQNEVVVRTDDEKVFFIQGINVSKLTRKQKDALFIVKDEEKNTENQKGETENE